MRRFFAPAHTYAERPSACFISGVASRMTRASKPTPAMTANISPFSRPTSSLRRAPLSPTSTAASMCFGMPRFDANRFAVPAGTIAMVAFDAGDDVDATLHHSVAAPDEDQICALLRARTEPVRGLAALGHLDARADR